VVGEKEGNWRSRNYRLALALVVKFVKFFLGGLDSAALKCRIEKWCGGKADMGGIRKAVKKGEHVAVWLMWRVWRVIASSHCLMHRLRIIHCALTLYVPVQTSTWNRDAGAQGECPREASEGRVSKIPNNRDKIFETTIVQTTSLAITFSLHPFEIWPMLTIL
jgi:hypothetical protein